MHGATEEEIDRAVDDGVIDLFVVDRLLVPSRRRYTRIDVAELTGVGVDRLERFWRALGFPGVDDDDRAFTDLDLEAVRLFQGLQALGAADADTAVQMARVIGSSMARIAEAELVPGDMASTEVDRLSRRRSPATPTQPFPPWRSCSSSCGGARWRQGSSAP